MLPINECGVVSKGPRHVDPLLAVDRDPFSRWYNTEHKHSGLKFTTPQQRHTGQATAILEHRQQVYRLARERHPNRWNGEIRNWELPEKVWLNPEEEQSDLNQAA